MPLLGNSPIIEELIFLGRHLTNRKPGMFPKVLTWKFLVHCTFCKPREKIGTRFNQKIFLCNYTLDLLPDGLFRSAYSWTSALACGTGANPSSIYLWMYSYSYIPPPHSYPPKVETRKGADLKVCLHNHGEVGVIRLRHVLLVLAKLDCHDVAQVGTRVIPASRRQTLSKKSSKPWWGFFLNTTIIKYKKYLPKEKAHRFSDILALQLHWYVFLK